MCVKYSNIMVVSFVTIIIIVDETTLSRPDNGKNYY